MYDPKGHPAYKGVWRDDEIAGDGVSFKKNNLKNSLSNNETASMFWESNVFRLTLIKFYNQTFTIFKILIIYRIQYPIHSNC